jgi:hypothetical protein
MSRQKQHAKADQQEVEGRQDKQGRKGKGISLDDRPILEPDAGGIDIGARELYAAVPPDRDDHPVRVFSTFTEDWRTWLSGW